MKNTLRFFIIIILLNYSESFREMERELQEAKEEVAKTEKEKTKREKEILETEKQHEEV